MKRTEFEHAVRGAASVLRVDERLVIGSQALHGSVEGDLPEEALRSVEVPFAALEDPEGRKADLIDGAHRRGIHVSRYVRLLRPGCGDGYGDSPEGLAREDKA